MKDKTVTMAEQKTIAVVAHDNKKQDLLAWTKFDREALSGHKLSAIGTTGKLLHAELGVSVTRLQSGPLGRDQQIGAKINEGMVAVFIFFWDLLEPHLHDPDENALLRIAEVGCMSLFRCSSGHSRPSYETWVGSFKPGTAV